MKGSVAKRGLKAVCVREREEGQGEVQDRRSDGDDDEYRRQFG
jgi:hypothetical protein